jgi:hypothetical protein
MTAKRAAGYCGGGLLLLAWLSYAAGASRNGSDAQEPSTPVETSGTESLAADIQSQTTRLKSRMATAPTPQEPFRNPFIFGERATTTPRVRREALVTPPPAPAIPPEPAIELIGVTTNQSPSGPVRTAVISALSGELFLVKEGETVATRYRVGPVTADAVDLIDLAVSGTTRRLVLKD